MRAILALVCICVSAFGQTSDGSTQVKSQGVPAEKWTWIAENDGSGNVLYFGKARSDQKAAWVLSVANAGLTSCVDATNTSTCTTAAAHGLAIGNKIYIGGATDVDLNGYYFIQTVGSATTFTITTANVTDATYNGAALYMSTLAPSTARPIWTIERHFYDGSSYWIRKATSTPNAIWDNRAVTTGATLTTYN